MSRRFPAAIAALALLVPAVATAERSTPAGVSSDNVRHVRHYPVGSAVGGMFLGDYYYLSTLRPAFYIPFGVGTGGIEVFDATNPRSPVPVGFLPMPISQNEDINGSAERGVLLVVQDRRKSVSVVSSSPIIGGVLFVIDISNPRVPTIASALPLPAEIGATADGVPLGGPGHTATCILDCRYAYITGSRDRSVHVVDLGDLSNPVLMGTIRTPAGDDSEGWGPDGVVHDVHVDRFGNVWMAGSGGTAMYAPVTDPMHPTLIAKVSPADNAVFNQLIHHGVVRWTEDYVIIGEEDFGDGACGAAGEEEGSLQVWRIDRTSKRLVPTAAWDSVAEGLPETLSAVGIGCSSHWFDVNRFGVVADGWYENGVRFLDVTTPGRIRQVGYFVGNLTAASQAIYHPGDSTVVYVADYSRGLDVIEIDEGGKGAPTIDAPAAAAQSAVTFARFEADPEWGYACRRLAGV